MNTTAELLKQWVAEDKKRNQHLARLRTVLTSALSEINELLGDPTVNGAVGKKTAHLMTETGRRARLTPAEQVKVMRRLDKGDRTVDIAKEVGLSPSSVCMYRKNNRSAARKRLLKGNKK